MLTNFSQYAWADRLFYEDEPVVTAPPDVTQSYQEGPWELVQQLQVTGTRWTLQMWRARLAMPLPEPPIPVTPGGAARWRP
jgi:hypothetical protein